MNVFICGSMEDETEIRKIAKKFEIMGHKITRKWWFHKDETKKDEYAREDKKGIINCDCFIMYEGNKKTSGKYVELGMAIILNKMIFVLGKELTTIYRTYTKYIGKEW